MLVRGLRRKETGLLLPFLMFLLILANIYNYVTLPFSSAYGGYNSRFLMPAWLLMPTLFFWAAERLKLDGRLLIAMTAILFSSSLIAFRMPRSPALNFFLLVIFLLLVFGSFAGAAYARDFYLIWLKSKAGRISALAAALLVFYFSVLLSSVFLESHRMQLYRDWKEDINSFNYYERSFDWEWVAKNLRHTTIAYTCSDLETFPMFFYWYPLLGADYSNRLVYVNINRENHSLMSQYPEGKFRIHPEAKAWLANLTVSGAQYLYIYRDRMSSFAWPVEDAWAGQNPEVLQLVHASEQARIYRIDRAPGGK